MNEQQNCVIKFVHFQLNCSSSNIDDWSSLLCIRDDVHYFHDFELHLMLYFWGVRVQRVLLVSSIFSHFMRSNTFWAERVSLAKFLRVKFFSHSNI